MYNRTDETDAVTAVAEDYFKAMINTDEAELRRVFHPQAPVTGLFGDEFSYGNLDSFIDFVKSTPAANENGKPLEYYVEGLVLVGDTAVVTVGCYFYSTRFTDHLSMIKINGDWCIVAKAYTTHPPAES